MKTLSYHDTHDEPLVAVRACVIYHMWRWRNSWHGSESLNYRSSNHMAQHAEEQALATTLAGAKKQAEDWRAPGSVFHIRELPSLVADAGSTQMVFAEINAHHPFLGWEPDVTLLGRPLHALASALWQYGVGGWDGGGRLRASLEPGESAEPLVDGRVFRDWSSSPAGAKRNQLGWSGKLSRTDAGGVREVERAFAAQASGLPRTT